MKRDFLTLQDYSKGEIWELLKATRGFKNRMIREANALKQKTVILLFQKSSTRTRISFEVAVNHLGGFPIYLGWRESQLGRGESTPDTARVLSRYVDCVVGRVFEQTDLEELAKYGSTPVINALSDLYHPCQIVADLYTVWENVGALEGLRFAYIGDGNNVCNSLLLGCSKMGVDISVASPKGYEPYSKAFDHAIKNSETSGSTVRMSRSPKDALKDVDVVYTDTFVSMGDESEREMRLSAFMPNYQVTKSLLRLAKKNALFMHCLPAHRNEEVTDSVIDGRQSVVWDQAENRLHTAKAILAKVMG